MFVLSVVKYTGLGIITLIKHSMFNLLSSKKYIYKYYYNTKLKDLNLLNPINIYLFYNNTIMPSILKHYKSYKVFIYKHTINNIKVVVSKSNIALLSALIRALLYVRIMSYRCVIYLNSKRQQSKLNQSQVSDCNGLEGEK